MATDKQPDEEVDLAVDTRPPRLVGVAIVGSFLILLAGAMYYARDFVLPVILALLVTLTFMPAVRWFARRGLPPPVSAVALVVLIALGIAVVGIILADPV